jgi:hypothetical protein
VHNQNLPREHGVTCPVWEYYPRKPSKIVLLPKATFSENRVKRPDSIQGNNGAVPANGGDFGVFVIRVSFWRSGGVRLERRVSEKDARQNAIQGSVRQLLYIIYHLLYFYPTALVFFLGVSQDYGSAFPD